MFSFNQEGSEELNKRAASFFKMAASSAQQFANNANTNFNGQSANVRQQQETEHKIVDELAASDKLLHQKTPDPESMTQPEDEPAETRHAGTEQEVDQGVTTPSAPDAASPAPVPAPVSASTPAENTPSRNGSSSPVIVSGIDISKLAPEVRSKLKKFAKYEEKYPVLLDAYKTEKAKSLLIRKFETLLQEHTPCSKISESEVLFQYLKDLRQKNELLNDEVKKLTGDLRESRAKSEQDTSKFQVMLKNFQKSDARLKELEGETVVQRKQIVQRDEQIAALQSAASSEETAKGVANSEELVKSLQAAREECAEKSAKIEQLESQLAEAEAGAGPEPEEQSSDVVQKPLSKSAKKKQKKKKQAAAAAAQNQPQSAVDDAVKETETTAGEDVPVETGAPGALQAQIQQHLATIAELRGAMEAAQEENESLKESLAEVGNELMGLKNGEQSEKALHLQHTEAITQYEKQVMVLRDQIGTLEAEVVSLKKRAGDAEHARQALQTQVGELEQERSGTIDLKLQINELNHVLAGKDKTVNDLQSKLQYLEAEKTGLNERYVEAKIAAENLKGQIKASNEQSNRMMTENEALKEELRQVVLKMGKLSTENSVLVKSRDEYRDKLTDATSVRSSNSDVVSNLQKVNDELNARSRELQVSFETLQEELNDARAMLQERTRETSTIRKMLVDLEEEKQALVKEFEFKLSKKSDEIDKLNYEVGKVAKRAKAEVGEMRAKVEEYERELEVVRGSGPGASAPVPSVSAPSAPAPRSGTEELLNARLTTLQDQLAATVARLKDSEKMTQILKKLNEDAALKFEKLNRNYRAQQQELKRTRTDSVDLQRRLSSASGAETGAAPAAAQPVSDNEDKISYIKNVLMGFVAKKDQRANLLPVVTMLLKLDAGDVDVLLGNLK